MEIQLLASKYISAGRVMQLATVNNGQPWICTVYFVSDDRLSLYWLSLPTRRHSVELAKNSKAAVTVAYKLDKPIIGVQAQGHVEKVQDEATVKIVMANYIDKYNEGADFYENFRAGRNQHQMYKFTPSELYVFDEVNFPGGERQPVSIPAA